MNRACIDVSVQQLCVCVHCFTRGVHPALSFRLGSAPSPSSVLAASTSPCRAEREEQHCGQHSRPVNNPSNTAADPRAPRAPLFINHAQQWAIDYLVRDPERDYGYVYRDYFKTVYSRWAAEWLSDHLKTNMFNREKKKNNNPHREKIYTSRFELDATHEAMPKKTDK